MKRFWVCNFLSVSVFTSSVQVIVALSLKSRTRNLWHRLSIPNKKRCHDGNNHSLTKSTNKDSSSIYSQVFGTQNQAPYVPSGLSAEEYERIRRTEAAEMFQKDFGAWGPRFAKSGRPDGDWFVLPQLWTAGIPENAQYKDTALRLRQQQQQQQQQERIITTRGVILRRWFYSLFLSFLLVNIVLTAVKLTCMDQITVQQAIWKSMKLSLKDKQLLLPQTYHYWAILFSKVFASMALSVPVQRGLDVWAKRLQWGHLRMMSITSLGATMALVVYALIMVGIRKVLVV